jgi:hypothetical protein
MKSIKLFTEKVMPNFKDDLDTEVKKVSWSRPRIPWPVVKRQWNP